MITKKVNWVGCQGSEPHLRGFPCSLWILFHFLTVQAAQQNVDRAQETGESGARAAQCLQPALSCLPGSLLQACILGSPRLQLAMHNQHGAKVGRSHPVLLPARGSCLRAWGREAAAWLFSEP